MRAKNSIVRRHKKKTIRLQLIAPYELRTTRFGFVSSTSECDELTLRNGGFRDKENKKKMKLFMIENVNYFHFTFSFNFVGRTKIARRDSNEKC